MISEFEETILSITEFRHDMTNILETLEKPRILMNRDKAKAVLVPYELYKAMEKIMDDKLDYILGTEAADRLNDSEVQYLNHKEFWAKIEVD
ncbi:MAG: type II toxin-antitoxin system Phd/YefM family antitoxin [Clostridia bacterium]|nr:type II toxin-antitoxin system Phd/YefM family antitoxin [Clostridia bacterium]MBN2883958.1 type II toxin-antitoxin system Phd/YefM family antitoxin [Clostridia bacterium]